MPISRSTDGQNTWRSPRNKLKQAQATSLLRIDGQKVNHLENHSPSMTNQKPLHYFGDQAVRSAFVTARIIAALALAFLAVVAQADVPETSGSGSAKASEAVPWSQTGAKAEAHYQGDGLSVSPKENGAFLRCIFQRLEGEATHEGLWLTSTASSAVKDTFRVVASAIGRGEDRSVAVFSGPAAARTEQAGWVFGLGSELLPSSGTVSVDGKTVRFARPGVVEEYTVSMDGVRQDFVVLQRPEGASELRLELAVTGAAVEATAYGARLALEGSGRKIAYGQLHVVDATGRELPARIEVRAVGDEVTSLNPFKKVPNFMDEPSFLTTTSTTTLAVLVNDMGAVYPIRIDPTFSDEDWISMGGLPGANGVLVSAIVVDDLGNLYVGGDFTIIGDVLANRVAKWDGNTWSPLGLGMDASVSALLAFESELYAGGTFIRATNTDGVAVTVNRIAKWNGSNWSALGSGMNSNVYALAKTANYVCAGGSFTSAGGNSASRIASWDGVNWSALGSGLGRTGSGVAEVYALAVLGDDLYAGGNFTRATNTDASVITTFYIARWNGSNWSAFNSSVGGTVRAMVASGNDLYAGGEFTSAGGNSSARYVARWDGNSWLAFGSGTDAPVQALAVSGGDLYAGSQYYGPWSRRINKWNGSFWATLGLDVNGGVTALVVSSGDLFVGGSFTTAGDKAVNRIAKWSGTNWSALSPGMNGQVNALVTSGSNLFAGGSFTTVGGNIAARF